MSSCVIMFCCCCVWCVMWNGLRYVFIVMMIVWIIIFIMVVDFG